VSPAPLFRIQLDALEPAKRGNPLQNRPKEASWIARGLQIGRTRPV
jgi:hypothetical protein